jgi:hypothetical protein
MPTARKLNSLLLVFCLMPLATPPTEHLRSLGVKTTLGCNRAPERPRATATGFQVRAAKLKGQAARLKR